MWLVPPGSPSIASAPDAAACWPMWSASWCMTTGSPITRCRACFMPCATPITCANSRPWSRSRRKTGRARCSNCCNQQLSLFNAHYDERCFLPIHIYEAASGKPVAMILREGKTPSGEEIRTVLKHVIKRIRRHWPRVHILVRGDSHYGRDEAMEWCEETQG